MGCIARRNHRCNDTSLGSLQRRRKILVVSGVVLWVVVLVLVVQMGEGLFVGICLRLAPAGELVFVLVVRMLGVVVREDVILPVEAWILLLQSLDLRRLLVRHGFALRLHDVLLLVSG